MTERNDNRKLITLGLALAAFTFSVLAYASWDQALDFDPCDNVFKPPSQKCVTSAVEPMIVAGFVMLVAGAIFRGLLTRGVSVLGSSLNVLLSVWMCLCAMLVGLALIFAVLTTDLPNPELEQIARAPFEMNLLES